MSYTLKYTGPDIDDILDRAVEGGEIDEELELKAPLDSPALTGEPTAPTQEEGDDSEKIATTAYADRAAAVAAYAAYPTDTALGAIASFPDGANNVPMKSVKVEVTPIQDLHGYDYPWPAGGGKNKMDDTVTDGHTAEVTLPAGTYYAQAFYTGSSSNYNTRLNYLKNGTWTAIGAVPYSADGVSMTGYAFGYAGSAGLARGYDTATLTLTAETTIRFGFSDTAKATRRLSIASEELTAYVPYSNLAPIDGWEGATVVRTGVNLVDGLAWTGERYYNDTGAITPSANTKLIEDYIPVTPSTAYAFAYNGNVATVRLRVHEYDTSKTWLRQKYSNFLPAPSGAVSITTSADAAYIRFSLAKSATDILVGAGTVYPVDWTDEAGTVYGGTLDVTTGVLTVTHRFVDMGDLEWSQGTVAYYATLPETPKVPANNSTPPDAICSRYPTATYNQVNGGNLGINIRTSNGWCYVYDDTVVDLTAFEGAVDGELFVYALATPQTVQLDPITVSSLLGQNNLYADSGDVEVEYRADVALYIEKKLGGGVSTLSMAPSAQPAVVRPGLSLNLTEDEPELITEDDEPDLAEDAPEALEE